MDTSSEPNCDAESLDWALFVLTIVSTHVTWWLLPLPALFKDGFRVYIHDVAWECLRLQVPSFIAFKSCIKQDRINLQMCYYSGVAKPITRLSELKAYVKDSFFVVSTVLALYRLGKGGNVDKDLSGLNVTLWNYPSLPIAMIGLGISVFSRTQVRPWIVATVTLAAILIVAAAIAVYTALT
ncbi:hypothetical protein GALMADRAFT_256024 [Galerina marginata CBS 339.88]|uniref:Uncharacterized protein n=1 Tax=Galerina marginata (strain CBS 339.88) TaxID=685588 RepID=A0A067SE00_GALM3|nr:hypothetical protein GALMADRAFT_256024 [Galerina marginata CBS 339.88]